MPKAYRTKRSRRISALIAALLALLAWSFREHITLIPGGSEGAPGSRVTEARPKIYYGPANSIAVLPFTCKVPGTVTLPTDEPALAEGLSRSLIDLLERVPGLQVSSSNSSFFFRDMDANLNIIAERLKVRYILEGCIGKNTEGIEVHARLFNVNSKSEEWSRTFAGSLDEVFGIQDEIIAAAVNAVGVGHSSAASTSRGIDPQAWLLFLEGRYLFGMRGLDNLQKAEVAFKNVLDLEPEFAPAMLGLARIYLDPAMAATQGPRGIEQAREAALAALVLDPRLAGAYLELSRIRRSIDWDWQGAWKAAQKALEFQPGNAEVLSNASTAAFTLGEFDVAVSLLQEAIKRDPLVLQNLQRLGLLYEFSGKYEDALMAYRMVLGLNSDYPAVHAYSTRAMLARSMPESALEEAELEQQPFWRQYARILSLTALERKDEAELLLQQMIAANGNDAAFQIAEIYAFAGANDQAFEWLDRAYRQRDGGMSELLGNYFLSGLENDDRWQELLTRMRLSD
jgi:TolB-like protein/Tfp pilus assembly protein PilF